MRFLTTFIIMFFLIISPTFIFESNNYFNSPSFTNGNYASLPQQKIMNNQKNNFTINITGDQDLLHQAQLNGWRGSGTKSNPITIEGYTFTNTDPYTYSSLSISNVDLFFVIKQNKFLLTNSSANYGMANIILSNSTNGVVVENYFNNPFLNDYEISIFINNSRTISINSNIFESVLQYSKQFYVLSSSEVIFSGNTFLEDYFNNLIYFDHCNNSEIINNVINNGSINLEFNHNVNITNNILNNTSLYISISNVLINYNTIENIKTIAGITINIDFTPIPVPINSYYHINNFLVYYGITIRNNLFENDLLGININHPANKIDIACPGLPECSDLSANYSGFTRLHYSNTLIKNNVFNNNSKGAILIGQYNDNNTIYENNFINNNQSLINNLNDNHQLTTQVYVAQPQNVSNNWFFNGLGNYWSDYNFQSNSTSPIGPVPIQILTNDSDPYPLLKPVAITYSLSTIPGAHWTNSTANLSNFGFSSIIPVLLVTSVMVVIIVFMYSSVQYRKFRRLKAKKHTTYNKFHSFLINNLPFKNKKQKNVDQLSDNTLELIGEIISENKET